MYRGIQGKEKSRDRNILEGDRNTAYFQAVANQRKRKKTIYSLKGANGETNNNKEMLQLAVDFYKNLFGFEEKLDIHLSDLLGYRRKTDTGGKQYPGRAFL